MVTGFVHPANRGNGEGNSPKTIHLLSDRLGLAMELQKLYTSHQLVL